MCLSLCIRRNIWVKMYCLVCFISLVIFPYPAGAIFFQIIFYIIKNSSTFPNFINYHYYKILQLNTSLVHMDMNWIFQTMFFENPIKTMTSCFLSIFAFKVCLPLRFTQLTFHTDFSDIQSRELQG